MRGGSGMIDLNLVVGCGNFTVAATELIILELN
jgi:hypothetical protein